MKFIERGGHEPVVELSRRNLETLLAKLSDPLSNRTIGHVGKVYVKAVENDEHYSDREPGVMYMPTEDVYV